jgi:Transposase DDE domain
MLHATSKGRIERLVSRFRCGFLQESREKLFDALPAAELERAVLEEVGSWRERLYSPLVTLRLFIEQVLHVDPACQDVVVRYASERVAQGEALVGLSTGPYCKARQRLPVKLLVRLCRGVGRRLEESSPQAWRWRGRSLILVDGATVTMPDTVENQAQYPQSRSQKAGVGFPIARLVVLISLASGVVLDWAMAACKGKKTGEDTLFRQLYGSLNRGDIVLVDRYHSSYFTIAQLRARGVDMVSRQHAGRTTDFRRGQPLGKHDHLVIWKRPKRPDWMEQDAYELIPEEMTVREAKVGKWVLVSTLTNPAQVSKAQLNALYVQRWHVELDLRSIKSVMGMDILRCKSPDMVHKEVSAFFLAYNLIRAVMAQAAACAKVLPRQLSFSGAKRVVNSLLDLIRGSATESFIRMFATLRGAVASLRLPWRPDRVEPRAVKRRPKPHRLLNESRDIARAKIVRTRICLA